MLLAQIFSGAGTGLLLGLLLGLSSSPVVGLVVGALAAMLASLIGIHVPGKAPTEDPQETVSAAQSKAAAVRAGVFGFACVLGLFAGITLRTHDALAPAQPTLKQKIAELRDFGFSDIEARRIAVPVAFEPKMSEAKPGPTPKPSESLAMLRATHLFAGTTERCERLDPDRYKDTDAAIAAYKGIGEAELADITAAIRRQLPAEEARRNMLRSVVEAVCAQR